jgi:hypothetical protein
VSPPQDLRALFGLDSVQIALLWPSLEVRARPAASDSRSPDVPRGPDSPPVAQRLIGGPAGGGGAGAAGETEAAREIREQLEAARAEVAAAAERESKSRKEQVGGPARIE